MHAPSEHTFDGEHYDLEVHVVHTSPHLNGLAVIGIMFDMEKGGDSSNPFINSLLIN